MIRHTLRTLSLSLLLAAPIASLANGSLIFERADIRIDATPVKNENNDITIGHEPINLNVEVRNEESLRLEYIHTLNTLSATGGVMIVLDSPAILSLPAMRVYKPVDAVFIDESGKIVYIAPHVTLAEMEKELTPKPPVKALLFLQDGLAASRTIRPRDMVVGKMFSTTHALTQ